MRDDSAAGLLAELNEKRSRWRLTPILAVLAIIGAALLWRSLPLAGQVAVVVFASAALLAVHQVDVLRKSTVVIYDLDSDAAASYQQLIDAIGAVGEANRVWHVPSQAQVFDRKYHAGAESQIRRTETGVTLGSAPFLKCNLDVSRLGVGVQTLYFFPDRLLVFDSSSIGAVAYEHLTVEQQRVQFIEESGVPSDSRVVGRTWRYMNKRGGPDRRFKDNRELPICEYEALHFRSTSGLNELLHASKVGVGDALIRYLTTRGRDQPAERQPPPHR
jgi:hypothetical protein